MTRLGPHDPLPFRPARVLVLGTSGSGKSTLAAAIGMALGLPHTEIDALFHGPGWVERPGFADDVRALAAQPRWVTEYQYSQIRDVLLARVELAVALDLPRRVVMTRLIRRTVQRSRTRQPLWNGNVEAPLRTILTNPDHIVRWGWNTHHRNAGRMDEIEMARPDVPLVVLRSSRDAKHWRRGPLAAAANELVVRR